MHIETGIDENFQWPDKWF